MGRGAKRSPRGPAAPGLGLRATPAGLSPARGFSRRGVCSGRRAQSPGFAPLPGSSGLCGCGSRKFALVRGGGMREVGHWDPSGAGLGKGPGRASREQLRGWWARRVSPQRRSAAAGVKCAQNRSNVAPRAAPWDRRNGSVTLKCVPKSAGVSCAGGEGERLQPAQGSLLGWGTCWSPLPSAPSPEWGQLRQCCTYV